MKFDVMLTGVGGEGVLTSGVVIARAANLEGHYVRGVQLHGLAQRGGVIPTFVRFGSEDEIHSPGIMQANADLILAFEPLEAVRACYYARKEKTIFVISDHRYIPVYSSILDIPYPKLGEITRRVIPFSKKVSVFSAHRLAKEKLGNMILGTTVLIGAATGMEALPLEEDNVRKAIETTVPGELEKNLEAFELGLKLGRSE